MIGPMTTPMHLVLRDGSPCAPSPIARDEEGARALAGLYAFGEGVTVRAMMLTTVDGAVAGADGRSVSIGTADDMFLMGVLRALADVVLVGAGTVRAEDYRRPRGRKELREPSRRPGGAALPALAIMTSTGELPAGIDPAWPTLLLCPTGAARLVSERSGWPSEQVIEADSPREVVDALSARGHRGIQLEGGPSALGRFATAGMLDEICCSTSHRTVGGPSPRMIDGSLYDQAWSLRSLLVGTDTHAARYSRIPDDRA